MTGSPNTLQEGGEAWAQPPRPSSSPLARSSLCSFEARLKVNVGSA